jgi:hypothetical protein
MQVKDYSEKAIVIVGSLTDLETYKNDILELGGKYNNSLTDKKNNKKFCGYVFPKTREKVVTEWINSYKLLNKNTITSSSLPSPTYISSTSSISNEDLLKRIILLEEEVKKLKNNTKSTDDFEDDEIAPSRRLLSK